jgi:hypothetical protein
MPSDFAEAGKRFETAIPVPELQVSSIRNRSKNESARHRSRVLIACALAAIVALGSGTVFAEMYGGIRIWLSGDRAEVLIHSFSMVQNPNADDLRRVTADATFPVVLPAGIPKGMHMNLLIFSPPRHPNLIEVTYRNAATDARSAQIILLDSSTVNHGEAPSLPNGDKLQVGQVTHWNVGQETVIAMGTRKQAEMKAAMSGMTPAESLVETLPMLYRITILGVQDKLADVADAIAPSEGRSVLADRHDLSQIATLAQSHKPLKVTRVTTFDTFPSVGGKPDWQHAQHRQIEEVVLSAGGVRALATVVASNVCGNGAKTGSGFTCEMLVNERSGRAYWVWTIPLNRSTPPTKYVVDAKTSRVVREPR